jgi:hypothetical protein
MPPIGGWDPMPSRRWRTISAIFSPRGASLSQREALLPVYRPPSAQLLDVDLDPLVVLLVHHFYELAVGATGE